MHPARSRPVIVHRPIDRQVDLAAISSAFTPSLGTVTMGDSAHVGGDPVHLGLVGRMELEHAVHVAHRWLKSRVGRIVREVFAALIMCHSTSMRNPSTPRSNQKRITSYIAACTAG